MNQHEKVSQFIPVYAVILILAVMASIYRPGYFSAEMVYMMLRQAAALGVLSIGHMFVMASGGTDLSLDANMMTTMVIFMSFHNKLGAQWLPVGILVALIAALIMGAFNGFLVTQFNVAAFLITMFTAEFINGIRRIIVSVTPMGPLPEAIAVFVKGEQRGEFPYAAYILFAVAIIAYFILNMTSFGRKLSLVGANSNAAELCGIRVKRIKMLVFCISGAFSLLAAIIIAGYTGYVDQETLASGMAFNSLIAVVLGGTVLGGGRATVIGTVGGALATTLILNVVVLFGFEIQHQYVFKGLILLAVVLISSLTGNTGFMKLRTKKFGIRA
ncbi:MAG: ABC transporter permease [Clostridia bacterium]|nr:ABC transporter permease [Clostridia bacterium]